MAEALHDRLDGCPDVAVFAGLPAALDVVAASVLGIGGGQFADRDAGGGQRPFLGRGGLSSHQQLADDRVVFALRLLGPEGTEVDVVPVHLDPGLAGPAMVLVGRDTLLAWHARRLLVGEGTVGRRPALPRFYPVSRCPNFASLVEVSP